MDAQEYRDGNQRKRIRAALAGAAEQKKKPVLVPWAPTNHEHPKKTAQPAEQARGMKPGRDRKGRFTK